MHQLSNEPAASRMKEPVNAVNDFGMLYKLATVGLLDAVLHPSYEAGLVFEHAINSLSHQLLGILSIGRGHFLEPRFDIRREMYFHTPKSMDGDGLCQGARTTAPYVKMKSWAGFSPAQAFHAPVLSLLAIIAESDAPRRSRYPRGG